MHIPQVPILGGEVDPLFALWFLFIDDCLDTFPYQSATPCDHDRHLCRLTAHFYSVWRRVSQASSACQHELGPCLHAKPTHGRQASKHLTGVEKVLLYY